MSIDWITVSAQIVNFLILVWLLKIFLYKPVIRAMDLREQRVVERLNQAKQHKQEANKERRHLLQQQAELERDRDQLLQDAKLEVAEFKHKLMDEARAEIIEIRNGWQQQNEQERNAFLESVQRKVADGVISIARKTLDDLANADLESQLIQTFMAKLSELSEADLKGLGDLEEPIEIVTSFALSKPQQESLSAKIRDQLAIPTEPEYRVSSELGLGLQLNAAGQRISWNLVGYLEDLSDEIDVALTNSKTG